jgi:hypothetical protein
MKKPLLWISTCLIILSSCASVHNTGSSQLPPGQAKKVDGEQSAKAYAPGQQKKNKNKPKGGPGSNVYD